MKHYFKNLLSRGKGHLPFLLILILSVLLRAYRLPFLTTFGGDQGVDFITVRDMVLYHKWTLIGIKTSIAPFFQGPLYLYILYPFFYFFDLRLIAGAYAAVTVSFFTIILLYYTVQRRFSKKAALFAALMFGVSPEFVIYGNTPLYQNFLPIFIIASLYLLLKRKDHFWKYIFMGLTIGLGMELHFMNIVLAASVFVFLIFLEKADLKKIISFIAGVITGLLPTVIFELRHNFLNVHLFLDYIKTGKTQQDYLSVINSFTKGAERFLGGNIKNTGFLIFILFLYLIFVWKSKDRKVCSLQILGSIAFFTLIIMGFFFSVFGPEYYLLLWIILLILIPAFCFETLSKRSTYIVLFMFIIINFSGTFFRLNDTHGYNMPTGLTLQKIEKSGEIIATDSQEHPNFNVATILDGGTRSFSLRYGVLVYGGLPESVDNYPNNNFLYILARENDVDVIDSNTWEVKSMRPFNIGKVWNMEDGVYIYRLDREIK